MEDQMTTTPEPQATHYWPPQTTPAPDGPRRHAANTPPWNGLDTFLRRGVMIAAFILLWVAVALGALALVGAGYLGSRLSDTSTVDTPTDLYPTDLPVAPGPGLCDIDPTADGC